MNKLELISKVSENTGLSKRHLKNVFDEFLNVMIQNIDDLTIRNFGKFKIVYSKPRKYHDIKKMSIVKSKGKKKVKFIASKNLL